MTWREFGQVFLRQAAYAAILLVSVLWLMERLIPGSVLPYAHLFWGSMLALLLTCVAGFAVQPQRFLRLSFGILLGFVFVLGLMFVTRNSGKIDLVFVVAVILFVVAFCFALAYPKDPYV